MKTTNVVQSVIDNEGVSDEALEMSIDESSSVFLMDALGKLYSQPARAALREYLANGIDAHIEAGGVRPAIEIALPSVDNRVLSIRDYGNGMSEDGFKNILRRYGASTKRHSNKLTGGFGLGAKAGFAMTDAFHMTSFQKGKRIKVRIFKNAAGKGFIEVIERTSTKEADGMLVEVPVPSGNVEELSYDKLVTDKFFAAYHDTEIKATAASRVRQGYAGAFQNEIKTLPIEDISLHNPENYEALEYGGTIVGWVGKRKAHNSPVRAVIGRVSYEIKRDSNGYGRATYGYSNMTTYSEKFGLAMSQLNKFDREVILNLPIGSVDLPSSREEITYSERSMKTIVAVSTSVHRMVEENVQRVVNAKVTGHEALCEIISLHSDDFWKASDLTWHGKTPPVEGKQGSVIFKGTSNVIRYIKTTESRKSLSDKVLTIAFPTELTTLRADKHLKTVMITAKDKDEYFLAAKKIRTNIADYQRAQQTETKIQVLLFPAVEPLREWFEHGEKLSLEEFVEIGKSFRSGKRAEAKAALKAQRGNPAFSGPVKTTAATREVFWVPVNKPVTHNNGLTISGEQEHQLLANPADFYYLSKAEVKDLSAELSNMFPTRQGVGGSYAYIDSMYVRLLPTLKSVLGEDAKLVFLPATRNMEEFKASYPKIPSVVSVLKTRMEDEWKQVEKGKKTDTYFAELFWLIRNRNKVSLINQFFRALTPGESVSMNPDLLEIVSYMGGETRSMNNRLNILTVELLGKEFNTKVTEWMEKKVAVVGTRYPLLTGMNPVDHNWDILKPEMVRYLKTCK